MTGGNDRAPRSGPRLLAVGGVHVFDEAPAPCTLSDAKPAGAVKDLGWADSLALEAHAEGSAQVRCGDAAAIALEIVAPVRLEIRLEDDGDPHAIASGERFGVRARLYDGAGRGLEMGKLTTLEWRCSPGLAPAADRSAGEFGLCGTCHGMYAFRATAPGAGWISAALGALDGRLEVMIDG
jgi:hypothetical protein